jgi:VCBS repeat protein/hemolysin type calcium-binding protein
VQQSLDGAEGDDALLGGAGNDTLRGGLGLDTVRFELAAAAVTVSLASGTAAGDGTDLLFEVEHAVGSGFADSITGDGGANRLGGGAGGDTLYGAGGADTLLGQDGDDVLRGGAGADAIDGGTGLDTASYEGASAGVVASLANPAGNTGEAAGDAYASIENLAGSPFADRLVGNAYANRLQGGAGADTLEGGGGYDTAVFAVSHGAATVARSLDDSWTVTSPLGTATLRGISLVQFADGNLVLRPVLVRDFDGDGRADILLHGQDGTLSIWRMNGAEVLGSATFTGPGSAWAVAGTGDFDGDDRADILWRGQGGEVAIWAMDGNQVLGGGTAGNPGGFWHVV